MVSATTSLDASTMNTMGSSFAVHNAISKAAFELFKDYDHPLLTPILSLMVLSMVPKISSMLLAPFEKLAALGSAMVSKIISWIGDLISRLYYTIRSQKMQCSYTVTVNQYVERQASELYEAVLWWIQTRPKEERELSNELEYYVPRAQNGHTASSSQPPKPTPDDAKKRLLSTVPQNKSSKIKLEDGTFIEFQFAKEEVEVPNQKKRNNLENKKIILTRYSEEKDQTEIFNGLFAKILILYAESKQSTEWKQKTFLNDKSGNWVALRNTNSRTLATTVLKQKDMQRLKNYLAAFADPEQQAWFKSIGRSQKLTFMLYGKPGCGKTTLEKAISAQFERDIYYLNLSNISTNEQLVQVFEKIPNEKSVIVIEEIDVATHVVLRRDLQDAYRAELLEKQKAAKAQGLSSMEAREDLHGQQNELGGTKLNMEGFLNVFDGHLDNAGRIMIITTNCIEKLDAAITRPGRVDCVLQLTECDLYQIIEMFKLYYGKTMVSDYIEEIEKMFSELKEKMGEFFVSPTPALLDSILLQYREDIDRGILALRNAIENPTDVETYIPNIDRLASLTAQVSTTAAKKFGFGSY